MLGGQGGQAPYLTSNNGVYYIDTNQQEANPSCFMQSVFEPGFTAGQSYVLYNLFANENTNVTYQLYVGDDFNTAPTASGSWCSRMSIMGTATTRRSRRSRTTPCS